MSVIKYVVYIMEYERGWGSRIDETRYFDTEEERDEFMREFNKPNTEPSAPDWYIQAENGGFVTIKEF